MDTIFKFKISKEVKEKADLKEGEYLIVKSLKGDTLILAKPKESRLKEKAILDIVGIGASGLSNISSCHDDYLYPSKKKSNQ